ncbi:hypothetical protein N9A67_05195 [Rhodobacteraceae bacterium]|nr:hypothetical protein [Paracoccaceae bacterium]
MSQSTAKPHQSKEITAYANELFEFGSVSYVHALDSPHISQNQQLFDRVARGEELDEHSSCKYRTAFWKILFDHQKRFEIVDADLVIAQDFGKHLSNNCGDLGIPGRHDLHDLSAKENYLDLSQSLQGLESGVGFWRSIVLINNINKDLVDLVVHMAPAVHSIGVKDDGFGIDPSSPFDQMQSHFKDAQFAPINSATYWQEISEALEIYRDIVEHTQTRILATSHPIAVKIAGRWMALQTIAPRLDQHAGQLHKRRHN